MSVSTHSAEPSYGDPTTLDHPRAPSGSISVSPPAYSTDPPGTVVWIRLPSKSPMYAVRNGTGVRSLSPRPATSTTGSSACGFACASRCASPARVARVSALALAADASTSIAQTSALARLIA